MNVRSNAPSLNFFQATSGELIIVLNIWTIVSCIYGLRINKLSYLILIISNGRRSNRDRLVGRAFGWSWQWFRFDPWPLKKISLFHQSEFFNSEQSTVDKKSLLLYNFSDCCQIAGSKEVKLQNGGFYNGCVTKHIYKLSLHKRTNIILKMTVTKYFLTFFHFLSKSSREARSFYDTLLNYALLFSSIKTYTVHVGVGSMGLRNQADCLGTNDCMVPLIHSMKITNWNAGPCQVPPLPSPQEVCLKPKSLQ